MKRPTLQALRVLGALIVIICATACSHTDPAYQAYQNTPIFGKSRMLVWTGDDYAYSFRYRGGIVTYDPYMGATWSRGVSRKLAGRETESSSLRVADLPNSCLLYACAKAEEIRLGQRPGLSNSHVVAYYKPSGRGHAFVVYKKNGLTYAEDDRRFPVAISSWRNGGRAEALRLAREFFLKTTTRPTTLPSSASFIGN